MNHKHFKLSTLSKAILPLMAGSLLIGCNSSSSDSEEAEASSSVRVYYKASTSAQAQSAQSDDYSGASLYVWNDESCAAYSGGNPDASDWSKGLSPDGVDDQFGAYWELEVDEAEGTECVNFIPRVNGDKPLGEYNAKADLNQTNEQGEVFTQEAVAAVYPELITSEDVPDSHVRIYMNTPDGDQSDFTLHTWNEGECTSLDGNNTNWPGMDTSGVSDTYGPYWDVPFNQAQGCINIIPNNGDYQTANLKFEFDKTTAIGNVAFLFKGTDKVYYDALANKPATAVELSGASAIFADDTTVLINNADATELTLYFSETAELEFDTSTKEVKNATKQLSSTTKSGTDWQAAKPHLANDFAGFTFDFSAEGHDLKDLLKGQLILVASDSTGVIQATEVQPASALDALYAEQAKNLEFGAILNDDGTTSFRLWAPTAQSVKLVPYSSDKVAQTAVDMNFDATTGSWEAEDTSLAHGDYYRYEVTVFHPATDKVETYEVTDPYSLSLAMNSQFTQVVDLTSADVTPQGWSALEAPQSQDNPAEFVLYEAHVRDFSAFDSSTSEAQRGKFGAFTESDSVPVQHLKALEQSGVTHLHLLPVFDIATINEDPDQVANINEPFSKLCTLDSTVSSDSDFGSYCSGDETIAEVFTALSAQDSKDNAVVQRLNGHVRNVDSFNWGYDPFHYTVPEGSYSTDAEGLTRIKEFREMVMAVKNDIGMNVVMDVVYNHTNESGVSSKSVLDRIVPWYYQRLNEFSGSVEQSTCCSNTAPENAMFGKLIDDSITTWVKEYKIDAFRWDLMGHHPLAQIEQTLAAAKAVDSNVYFYGEGWNFGEVANDRMFVQATQPNLGGTGIGSFSDRLRDAVRGGSPFDSEDSLRSNQGFGNGAAVLPNDLAGTPSEADTQAVMHLADIVRLGMAGNLKDYEFTDSNDVVIKGSELDYNGQAAGYAVNASEIQNYVSKHDNQTLWDNNQYKIAYDVPVETRVRMQAVSLSTALLGQGVPFIHMGSEFLRSKSMQRDSYDSGDWYNLVDFTKADNNWDVGLPREDKDGSNWDIIENVIDQSAQEANPTASDIETMDQFFKELTALRASSGLMTLDKGTEIEKRVQFHNTGSEQILGLIVMSIDNSGANFDANIDGERDGLVVVVNASPTNLEEFSRFDATGYALHSLQTAAAEASIARNGGDVASVSNNKLSVPAWSVAVFEKTRD